MSVDLIRVKVIQAETAHSVRIVPALLASATAQSRQRGCRCRGVL